LIALKTPRIVLLVSAWRSAKVASSTRRDSHWMNKMVERSNSPTYLHLKISTTLPHIPPWSYHHAPATSQPRPYSNKDVAEWDAGICPFPPHYYQSKPSRPLIVPHPPSYKPQSALDLHHPAPPRHPSPSLQHPRPRSPCTTPTMPAPGRRNGIPPPVGS